VKNFTSIETRLAAIEKTKPQGEVCYRLSFPTQAEATASVLSNGMRGDPTIHKIEWPGMKPPTDDRFKIKWIGQYGPGRLAGFCGEWMKSPWGRDKIALRELKRLLDSVGGAERVREMWLKKRYRNVERPMAF